MKSCQFSIRWLLGITVIAAVYFAFVHWSLYAAEPYRTGCRVLLFGLTTQIAIETTNSLKAGTFFTDDGIPRRKTP
jgi:hypothetical protein